MAAKRQPLVRFGLAFLLGCVLILTAQTGRVSAVPNGDGTVYVVQAGDRLVDIAARYGVTASALVQANDLANADTIFVGQRLIIPGSSVSAPTPSGSTSDTSGTGQGATYTVRRGDTLAAIARKYSVSMAALQRANDLSNPNIIWVGQKLVIPGASAVATQTPTPTSQPTAAYSVLSQPTIEPPATVQPTTEPAATVQPTTEPPATVQPTAVTPATALPTTETPATAQPAAVKPPTAQPTPKPASPKTHTVQAGETLSQIARQYGVSVDALVASNGLASADLIRVGMRLVIPGKGSSGTTSPGTTATTGKATKFVASISEQRCWLYNGTTVIAKWVCSTGRRGAGTRVGTFRIQSKMAKAYGSTWNIWMPFWLGIYWAGGSENGIHGLPWNASTGVQIWSGNVGMPITYGCIMLNNVNAKTLYDVAYIGMPVVIRP